MSLIKEVILAVTTFMAEQLGLDGTVVSVEKTNEQWLARAEAVIIDPDMRRIAKKDLVATFEFELDHGYKVRSFTRKAMRERGSVAP